MDTAKLKRGMLVNRNYKGGKCRDTNKSEGNFVSLQTKLTNYSNNKKEHFITFFTARIPT
jgi:hypothetical protein